MNKTPNYQLNQWEAEDKVQRVDFNADNAKLDAALGAKAEKTALAALQSQVNTVQASVPKIAIGTYTGDGAASRFIDVGFAPRAVLVIAENGHIRTTAVLYGGLAVPGCPAKMEGSGKEFIALSVSGTGFRVYYDYSDSYFKVSANVAGSKYNYIAIG